MSNAPRSAHFGNYYSAAPFPFRMHVAHIKLSLHRLYSFILSHRSPHQSTRLPPMSQLNDEVDRLLEGLLSEDDASPMEVEETKEDEDAYEQPQPSATEQHWLNESLISALKNKGNITAARQLLKQGADPNYRSPLKASSKYPIYLAIKTKKLKLVTMLLDHKADPNLPPPNARAGTFMSRSALYCAAANNCMDIVQALLPHIKDLNPACDPPTDNSIARAIDHDYMGYDMVKLLHEKGVRMPFQRGDAQNANPLPNGIRDKRLRMYCIRNGMHVSSESFIRLCQGYTGQPIHDEIRELCERGANVNPCWKSCDYGPAHARPDGIRCSCNNPLSSVLRINCIETAKCVSVLLEFGADPNGNYAFPGRPLYEAVNVAVRTRLATSADHFRKAKLLLDARADPTIPIYYDPDATVLSLAYNKSLYSMLLDHGAVAYYKDHDTLKKAYQNNNDTSEQEQLELSLRTLDIRFWQYCVYDVYVATVIIDRLICCCTLLYFTITSIGLYETMATPRTCAVCMLISIGLHCQSRQYELCAAHKHHS